MVQAKSIWIKNPQAIFSPVKDACGGLVVRESKIIELVSAASTPQQHFDETFDASEHVVLPGLINTHHHFYQTLTRAYSEAINKPLFPWLMALYPVWARLTPEHIQISSRLAMVELMLSGCTTVADHHYVFPKGLSKAIDIQVGEASELGIRAVLTRGSMSLSQKDGGLPPDSVVQDEATILLDCERLINNYHDSSPGAMMQIAMAPCSPFSVTTSLMHSSAQLAESHQVLLHTHLAETHDETDFCLQKFGMRPIDYLESVGWLNNRTWLAHGIHFNNEEIKRLAKAGVGVCHCASSNMILSSGVCPVHGLEKAGVSVGIGVDGSASNDCSNLIREIRMAFLLQRLHSESQTITHLDAIRWATQGSAQCLNRDDIGVLEVGKQADLALFKLDELQFSGSQDPLAALILCGAHQVDYLMVNGQWRVISGQIEGIDVEKLKFEHHQAAESLWC